MCLRGANEETISSIGNFDSFYKKIRNWRKKSINPLPHIYNIIGISERLDHTHTEELFYRCGPDNLRGLEIYDDTLLFYSDKSLFNLYYNDNWCIDDTLSIVLLPYYQLIVIGYLDENHVYPAIYAVIKNKMHNTYENIFRIIEQLHRYQSPINIKTDFEPALIEAVKYSFPRVNVSCCLFHLGQNVHRRIKDNGLSSRYLNEREFKKQVKALTALAFVKKEKVE